MSHHDKDNLRIHFRRDNDRAAKHAKAGDWPVHLTILKPDFTCDGYDQMVYDRNYVVDLVIHITGDGNTDAGTRLLAVLRSGER